MMQKKDEHPASNKKQVPIPNTNPQMFIIKPFMKYSTQASSGKGIEKSFGFGRVTG
jgi:hypothetical protein